MDGPDIAAVVGLIFDVLSGYVSYRIYKGSVRAISDLLSARKVSIDGDLEKTLLESKDRTLDYAMVEGVVQAVGQTIKSRNGDNEGVVQNLSIVEHRSKRVAANVWSDSNKVIQDAVEYVPFYIQSAGKDKGPKIHVLEPKSASLLKNNLTVTYDKFEQNQSGFFTKGVELLTGELSKGVHESEKMLLVGAQVLGIGQLNLEKDVGLGVTLSPPTNGKRYVLTKLSFNDVLKLFEKRKFWSNIVLSFALLTGSGLVVFLLYRWYKRVSERERAREMLQELRQQRAEARALRDAARTEQRQQRGRHRQQPDAEAGQEEEVEEENACVICLVNPREVVAISCGHVCLCFDCIERLPQPHACPVCRSRVERFMPVYNP